MFTGMPQFTSYFTVQTLTDIAEKKGQSIALLLLDCLSCFHLMFYLNKRRKENKTIKKTLLIID